MNETLSQTETLLKQAERQAREAQRWIGSLQRATRSSQDRPGENIFPSSNWRKEIDAAYAAIDETARLSQAAKQLSIEWGDRGVFG